MSDVVLAKTDSRLLFVLTHHIPACDQYDRNREVRKIHPAPGLRLNSNFCLGRILSPKHASHFAVQTEGGKLLTVHEMKKPAQISHPSPSVDASFADGGQLATDDDRREESERGRSERRTNDAVVGNRTSPQCLSAFWSYHPNDDRPSDRPRQLHLQNCPGKTESAAADSTTAATPPVIWNGG